MPAGVTGMPLVIQMVIQGATFIAATLIVFLGIAWGAGTLADRLRSPRFQAALNRISAVIFLGLAVFTLIP